ncbi:MAG: bifunctional riboflavin kinase/FAD synthetase [bacterium]|nr:bifunctional riboflavin kinase/FAD synthetase [bacterium]
MPEMIQVHADEIYTSGEIGPAVTTVGTFDGVHLGHQEILTRLSADNPGKLIRTVVTFEPHPQSKLHVRSGTVPILTTTAEKVPLLRQCGVDRILILKFTTELQQLSASEFLTKILLERLKTKRLVVGYNHSFGKDRQGDLNFLRSVSGQYDFELDPVEAHYVDGEAVSSTKVRRALQSGEISKANRFLGRPYFLSGQVVSGQKLGRELRFPTANLSVLPPEKLAPANGVYAVTVKALGRDYPGMVNIGNRPTIFGDRAALRTFEAHLIGFDGDLYGKIVDVYFLEKLRDEKKFDGINLLIQQMEIDKQESLKIYENYQAGNQLTELR